MRLPRLLGGMRGEAQRDGRVRRHRQTRPRGRQRDSQLGCHHAAEVGHPWSKNIDSGYKGKILNIHPVPYRCLLLKEYHEQDWKHFERFTSLLTDLKKAPDWPEVERNVVDQIVDRWRH